MHKLYHVIGCLLVPCRCARTPELLSIVYIVVMEVYTFFISITPALDEIVGNAGLE